MKISGLLYFLILCSCSSVSQTSRIYFENIGTCKFEPLCMTSLFQIEKDTLIWEEHCKQNISSLIGVHITNDQITRLDSLIQKSDFIHSKVVDVTSDTTLNQIQNIDFCMTEKYPAGSYLISAYDKNCLVQYQYLILGGDKMKSIFIFLKEQFPNDKQNEDINKILDSNLEIIQSCFE